MSWFESFFWTNKQKATGKKVVKIILTIVTLLNCILNCCKCIMKKNIIQKCYLVCFSFLWNSFLRNNDYFLLFLIESFIILFQIDWNKENNFIHWVELFPFYYICLIQLILIRTMWLIVPINNFADILYYYEYALVAIICFDLMANKWTMNIMCMQHS